MRKYISLTCLIIVYSSGMYAQLEKKLGEFSGSLRQLSTKLEGTTGDTGGKGDFPPPPSDQGGNGGFQPPPPPTGGNGFPPPPGFDTGLKSFNYKEIVEGLKGKKYSDLKDPSLEKNIKELGYQSSAFQRVSIFKALQGGAGETGGTDIPVEKKPVEGEALLREAREYLKGQKFATFMAMSKELFKEPKFKKGLTQQQLGILIKEFVNQN